MSNILHKIKDAVTNDKQSSSTSSGDSPYSSNVTNDPRVDSDRDYSAATGGVTGDNYGTDSATSTYGSRSANTGRHSSNVANKLDPRVDSGIDYRNTQGGVDDAYGTGQNTRRSNIADKLDPRDDSGMDSSARYQDVGAGGAGNSYMTPGSGGAQRTAGPHDSDLMNKVDPRVDSDLDNSGTMGGNYTRY